MISGLDPSTLGVDAQRELLSLAREENPELYERGLLALGQRLVRQDRLETALRIFHSLREKSSPGSEAATLAAKEIDAIEGRGAAGARFEFSLRRLGQEATNPALLAGMAAAGAVFQLSRAAVLGRLLASPTAGFLTRGVGARAIAGATGFALEAPGFVGVTHGVRRALGEAATGNSWSKEVAGAYLSLGGLKLLAYGGEWAAAALGGGMLPRAILPQLSAYLGVLAGKSLEHLSGLHPIRSRDTLFLDALTTLFQFRVGGELAQRLAGSGWARFQQGLHLAAEQAGPSSSLALSPRLASAGAALDAEILSSQPFAIQGGGKSGIWRSEGAAPSSSVLKLRWVPEGLPRFQIEESLDPVGAIVSMLESHLKRIHPSSLEIHYQGRMLGIREQEALKERVRELFEERIIPEGLLAAVAFMKGMPKMALIYNKENGKLNYRFTQFQVSEPSGPAMPAVAKPSVIRSLNRIEEIHEQITEIFQNRNPKINFEGAWNIRDAMLVAQMLEKTSGGLQREQTLTILLREKAAQVVFAWETESGVKRITWKTQPIDSSSLHLLAATPSESKDRPSQPEMPSSPPPAPSSGELPALISCKDRNEALQAFLNLLSETGSFQTPPIELRRGSLNEGDLGILAEILNNHPLPEGRKISLVWHERPAGLFKVHNENGRITAELRQFGLPIQNYLLKPYLGSGEKRFVRSR